MSSLSVALFFVCGIWSGKKGVNKKRPHFSVLVESQLAGRLGTACNFAAYFWDSLCISFQHGDFNKTSAVGYEHPGISSLFLGNAPGERKRHWEGDLVPRNGNAHPAVQRHAGSCGSWS